MSRRESVLSRVVTLAPNRKFDATRHVALDAGLVDGSADAAFVRANAAFVWTYYARFALLANGRARKRMLDGVTSNGAINLDAAIEQDRGVILLSVHLGDFDVAGAWLAARCDTTPVVVARPVLPCWRDAAFATIRRRCGVVVRDATHTSLVDLESDLQRRRAILVMLDRRPPGPTATSRILGRPAVAPLGIAALAARTKAPLLPVATWRDEDGSVVAWFGEPFAVGSRAEGIARIAGAAEQLGTLIRAHPEQWHVPGDLSQMAWSSVAGDVQVGERVRRHSGRPEHVPIRQDA